MDIECPHCHVEFDETLLTPTLNKGKFKCLVCGKKFPCPIEQYQEDIRSFFSGGKLLIAVLIVGALSFFLSFKPDILQQQKPSVIQIIPRVDKESNSRQLVAATPPAVTVGGPVVKPAGEIARAPSPIPDKMRIVQKIATEFHKTHTYTLEGDFVCLDMAVDIWNQLVTNRIDAKIMGGNIKENITGWNYRNFVKESNHAWVVARLDHETKIAVETTSGVIIKPGMKNSAAYFKGIEFDTPAQIRRFDSRRTFLKVVCAEAKEMIDDWNSNVAGKQRISTETIRKKVKAEQRVRDCENAWNALEEFKARAIFY